LKSSPDYPNWSKELHIGTDGFVGYINEVGDYRQTGVSIQRFLKFFDCGSIDTSTQTSNSIPNVSSLVERDELSAYVPLSTFQNTLSSLANFYNLKIASIEARLNE